MIIMLLRKSLLVLIALFLVVLVFRKNVQAGPIDPNIFNKTKINPCVLLGTCPTSTPTSVPTNTPVPAATETSVPPTNTPVPPTYTPVPSTETSIPSTQAETLISPESGTTLLPTQPGQSGTPTATLTPPAGKYLSQREMVFGGAIIFLVLLLLKQSWPKIKLWLHEKTK
jgi:hypothetical protein